MTKAQEKLNKQGQKYIQGRQNSIRLEHQYMIVDHNEWIKSRSGYYKNLSITPEGKLAGMKR